MLKDKLLVDQVKLELKDIQFIRLLDQIYLSHPNLIKIIFQYNTKYTILSFLIISIHFSIFF